MASSGIPRAIAALHANPAKQFCGCADLPKRPTKGREQQYDRKTATSTPQFAALLHTIRRYEAAIKRYRPKLDQIIDLR